MAETEFTTEELESEVWKDVQGFPGYQVSSLGRIRSIKLLKPCPLPNGYTQVSLYKKPSKKGTTPITRAVHVLVAKAFLGERPAGTLINHIDGVKTHPRADNLEYCTPSENCQHANRLGLNNHMQSPEYRQQASDKAKHGEDNPHARLTETQVRQIRALHCSTMGYRALAKMFGVSHVAIRAIVTGKTWKRALANSPK